MACELVGEEGRIWVRAAEEEFIKPSWGYQQEQEQEFLRARV